MLGAFGSLFEDIFVCASLESVLKLLNRLESIDEIVGYLVNHHLVGYRQPNILGDDVNHAFVTQTATRQLMSRFAIVCSDILHTDNPGPDPAHPRRFGIQSDEFG